MPEKRYALVSCHVERPLDDAVWSRFSTFQERRPGGFPIAALMRPPHEGEDRTRWLERARQASRRAPLGHHTHWTSPTHARPTGGDTAGRVRAEAVWLRVNGLEPRLFCGGGWYMDAAVAAVLAELGYTDCSATSFRPAYLEVDAPRLALDAPAWVRTDGGRVFEVPSTHSVGMAVSAAFRRLPAHVHVYFHDTDLLDPRRRRGLAAALRLLGLRRSPADLDRLAADTARELEFSALTTG